ncbi:MAG: hypothetical protein DRH21_04165 [Deltaproteobacteria bacterium]|nr:MAG: hypothetical protein DRH21_04165 [Deltaproteobacteria bacterium]
MFKGLILILFMLVLNMGFTQDIVINEMMSSNGSTIEDDFGDHSDWIELYNNSSESISIFNWYLSDNEESIDKWQFPDTTIFPHDFLLVFCSGKDTLSDFMHADFKLKSSGESIILSDDNENIIDHYDPVILGNNISYGCKTDGSVEKSYFFVSSPGFSNSYGRALNNVSFSHDAGFYETNIDLSINMENPIGQIYYTINGNEPHPDSSGTFVYEEPISIVEIQNIEPHYSYIPTAPENNTSYYPWVSPSGDVEKYAVIRTRVFDNDQALCNVSTNTYFIGSNMENRFSLPVLSVIIDSISLFSYDTGIYVPGKRYIEGVTKSGNYSERGEAWERKATLEYFSETGELLYEQDLGLRLHGNITRAAPQKPLQFIPRNRYDGNDKIDYPFFEDRPFENYKRIISRSIYSAHNRSIVRDEIAQDIAKDLDVFYQQWQPVITFINGEYWGVQNLREKMDENYLKQHFDISTDSVDIIDLWGVVENGDLVEHSKLMNFVSNNDLSFPENYEIIKTMIDIPAYIDYNTVEIFSDNRDWPGNNYTKWREKGENNKWRWFLYDLDGTMFNVEHNNLLRATGDSSDIISPLWSTKLFNSLLQNEEFSEQFLSRFVYLLNNDFSPEKTIPIVDKWEAIFENEIENTIDRWGILNDINDWRERIQSIRNFLELRPCILKYHLEEYFNVENLEVPCDSGVPRNPNNQDLNIYPNPVKNTLCFFSTKEIIAWEMYDMSGVYVDGKKNFYSLFEQIDVSGLQGGVYTLILYTKEDRFIRKVVKN